MQGGNVMFPLQTWSSDLEGFYSKSFSTDFCWPSFFYCCTLTCYVMQKDHFSYNRRHQGLSRLASSKV